MAAKSTKKRKTTTKKPTKKQQQENAAIRDEICILCVLAVCILLLISNFGIGGMVGEAVSSVLFGLFGWIAYLIPVLIFSVVAFLISNRGNSHAYIKSIALFVLVVLLATLLELIMNPYDATAGLMTYYRQSSVNRTAGGLFGGFLMKLLCPLIGKAGTYVVVIVLAIVCVILITEKSLLKPLGRKSKVVYEDAKKLKETTAIKSAQKRAAQKKEKTARLEAQAKEQQSTVSKPTQKRNKKVSGVSFATTLLETPIRGKSPELKELIPEEPVEDMSIKPLDEMPELTIESPFDDVDVPDMSEPVPETETMAVEEAIAPIESVSVSEETEETDMTETTTKQARKHSSPEEKAEVTKETESVEAAVQAQNTAPAKKYLTPPLDLLKKGKASGGDSNAHLRATAMKLEQTLLNFGVKVHVTNASCGPAVTRYELQPEQGVKVSKIVGLADDIKLNLAVSDLRIEAPIPGKAAVGIEVPNEENTAVMLRDLLEAPEFQKSKAKLAFAVGKDIAGKVIVADIAKMPHLLVAGATGSGKSVCINTIIMSLIYKADPEDVKLIMVDPKVVELNVYNGIPHLLIPVVTDPRKAAGALNWAVAEMMKRYQLFAEYNVRDLKGFNEKVSNLEPAENNPKKMAQIVIIVDELADLMMVAPKDVEGAICRLAQLARAAGIHLILATQRPSVNVITGLIKANMPSRIAFAVSSGVDSRTIIDMNGAEKLLGKGDMLFYPTGYPKPVRVQGSFVSDKEVQQVVDYPINQNGGANYSSDLEEHLSNDNSVELSGSAVFSGNSSETEDNRDHYFADAGFFIIEKEKASIGMLQRMFKIGFNRAARIMDQLAEAQVVGPEEGTKPRKVLMTKEEFEEYLGTGKKED